MLFISFDFCKNYIFLFNIVSNSEEWKWQIFNLFPHNINPHCLSLTSFSGSGKYSHGYAHSHMYVSHMKLYSQKNSHKSYNLNLYSYWKKTARRNRRIIWTFCNKLQQYSKQYDCCLSTETKLKMEYMKNNIHSEATYTTKSFFKISFLVGVLCLSFKHLASAVIENIIRWDRTSIYSNMAFLMYFVLINYCYLGC